MLTYSFAAIGSDSLYQHLYKCIKNDILSHKLAPKEKLPSKRAFAKNLGISVITIENAYAQLIAEGYIYSIPKKGFFVADIGDSQKQGIALTSETVNLSLGEHKYFADFTSNQTLLSNFPFATWAKLMREILSEYQQPLMTNPPCGGIMPLREAITHHLHDFCGIQVKPEQIIIGAGTEYLYSLLIQLLGFDKHYAVEDPGYQKLSHIYEKHRVSCAFIPMDELGISIDSLEAQHCDVLHLSPSHHFPTGHVTPISRRYELLGWASKNERHYIIEDDYDSEFRMVGQPIPPLFGIDQSERVIYMNTFTKSLASTIRISYMVLPMSLTQRFYKEFSFYSCTVSTFEQYTLARFISEGYFEKHLNRMRNYYHTKRDHLLQALFDSRLAPLIHISGEDAGLHFILTLDTTLTDEEVLARALRQGVHLAALSDFYEHAAPQKLHQFVINYTSVPQERLAEAIERFCDAILS